MGTGQYSGMYNLCVKFVIVHVCVLLNNQKIWCLMFLIEGSSPYHIMAHCDHCYKVPGVVFNHELATLA